MSKKNFIIVDVPDIILDDEEKVGDVLLKFYKALGWNGEDYLDPSKIKTTSATYNRLLDLMADKCPDLVSIGMHMVNRGPSVDDSVPIGKVRILDGWTRKQYPKEAGE